MMDAYRYDYGEAHYLLSFMPSLTWSSTPSLTGSVLLLVLVSIWTTLKFNIPWVTWQACCPFCFISMQTWISIADNSEYTDRRFSEATGSTVPRVPYPSLRKSANSSTSRTCQDPTTTHNHTLCCSWSCIAEWYHHLTPFFSTLEGVRTQSLDSTEDCLAVHPRKRMLSRYRVVIQNALHSSMIRPKPPRDQHCYFSSFTWSGPRALNDILKKELLIGKSREEISDIWLKYHQEKVRLKPKRTRHHWFTFRLSRGPGVCRIKFMEQHSRVKKDSKFCKEPRNLHFSSNQYFETMDTLSSFLNSNRNIIFSWPTLKTTK